MIYALVLSLLSLVAGENSQVDVAVPVFGQQTGIYSNYPIQDLYDAGYKECYSTLYSSVTNSSHLSQCSDDPNAMIVVASLYGTAATTVKLGGGGMSSNVFAKTASTATAYCFDGACWYNYPAKSFGFASYNYVQLNPADTYNTNSDTTRLSWNLDNGNGGYRSGTAINLYDDSTYRKVIYRKTDPMFRIFNDYLVSDLTKQGYKECYNAPYSAITSQDSFANCLTNPEKRVFVGAMYGAGNSKIMVGAGGIAGDVFAKTSSSSTATLTNGVYWYNYDGKSFGFAPKSTIYLQDADTYDIDANNRVSWHLTGDAGGWRAGSVNSLTNDSTYRKIIYVQA